MVYAYNYRESGFTPGRVVCSGVVVATSPALAEKITREDNAKILKGNEYFSYTIVSAAKNGQHILLQVS